MLVRIADAALAVTKRWLLVDKSDITNFPHKETGHLRLTRLTMDIVIVGTGVFTVRVGLVTKLSATVGDVHWLFEETFTNAQSVRRDIEYNDLPLKVSADKPFNFLSSSKVTGSTNWQSDVAIPTPWGTDAAPGVGDIVMELEEVSGTATISHGTNLDYKSNR